MTKIDWPGWSDGHKCPANILLVIVELFCLLLLIIPAKTIIGVFALFQSVFEWFDHEILELPPDSKEGASGHSTAVALLTLAIAQAGAIALAVQGIGTLPLELRNDIPYSLIALAIVGAMTGMYLSTVRGESRSNGKPNRRTFDKGSLMSIRWMVVFAILILGGARYSAAKGWLPGMNLSTSVVPTKNLDRPGKRIDIKFDVPVSSLEESQNRLFVILSGDANLDWDIGTPRTETTKVPKTTSSTAAAFYAEPCYASPVKTKSTSPQSAEQVSHPDHERLMQPRAVEIEIFHLQPEDEVVRLVLPVVFDDYRNQVVDDKVEPLFVLAKEIADNPTKYIRIVF